MAYALHRATLALHTPLGTPLAGDTLFGQIGRALREASGEAELKHQLDGYTQGQPWLVVSDGFPAGYLPETQRYRSISSPSATRPHARPPRKSAGYPPAEPVKHWQRWLATAVDDEAAYGKSPALRRASPQHPQPPDRHHRRQ